MKLKKVKKMPTEGQFVAMWIWKGEPFAATCKYNERGFLECYSETSDAWEPTSVAFPDVEIQYFVVGD